jgi:hypothetical protein
MAAELARQLGQRPMRSRPVLSISIPLEGSLSVRTSAATDQDAARLWDWITNQPALAGIVGRALDEERAA